LVVFQRALLPVGELALELIGLAELKLDRPGDLGDTEVANFDVKALHGDNFALCVVQISVVDVVAFARASNVLPEDVVECEVLRNALCLAFVRELGQSVVFETRQVDSASPAGSLAVLLRV